MWDRVFSFALMVVVLYSLAERVPAESVTLGEPPLAMDGPAAIESPHSDKQILSVDRFSRDAVVALYQTLYLPGELIGMGWTGNGSSCTAGTNSALYLQATVDRINYYRAMAGVPGNIVLDADLNAQCQEAALMMSAEDQLDHNPNPSYACFTEEGRTAAGKSNLTLGEAGPEAIDVYMEDFGLGNKAAGHRRWILFPRQTMMGAGNVPADGSRRAANALWVVNGGPASGFSQPAAWPSDGFFPKPLMIGRWSYSHPGADFSEATVEFTVNGVAQAIIPFTPTNGFGDNTLVWDPIVAAPTPGPDVVYRVTIENFTVGGEVMSKTYEVIGIDVTGILGGEGEGEGENISSLHVELTDASTGALIENGSVSLDPEAAPAQTANVEGVYSFSELPFGSYAVTATANGYASAIVQVQLDEAVESVALEMESGGAGEGEGEGVTLKEAAESLERDFVAADTNGDGELNTTEARAQVPTLTLAQFELFDANGNGKISESELRQVTGSGGEGEGEGEGEGGGGCNGVKRGATSALEHIGEWFLGGLSLAVLAFWTRFSNIGLGGRA